MSARGYTLVEVLVVTAIVGILAIVALPRYREARDRAFVTAIRSDLNQIRTAQVAYSQGNDFSFADDISELKEAGFYSPSEGVSVTLTHGDADSWSASANHRSTMIECSYDDSVGTVECATDRERDESGPDRDSGGPVRIILGFFEMLGLGGESE